MKIRHLAVLLLGPFIVFGCNSSSVSSIQSQSPLSHETISISQLEERVYQLTNRYRQSQGLSILKKHAGLSELAREHSARLQREAREGKSRIHHRGYKERLNVSRSRYQLSIHEIISVQWGNARKGVAERLFESYLSSNSHRRILRLQPAEQLGIGVVVGPDNYVYLTGILGVPRYPNSF